MPSKVKLSGNQAHHGDGSTPCGKSMSSMQGDGRPPLLHPVHTHAFLHTRLYAALTVSTAHSEDNVSFASMLAPLRNKHMSFSWGSEACFDCLHRILGHQCWLTKTIQRLGAT